MTNRELEKRIETLETQIVELNNKKDRYVWCEDTKRVMPIERVYEVRKDGVWSYHYEFSKNFFVEKSPNYDSVSMSRMGETEYYAGTIKVDKPVPKIY